MKIRSGFVSNSSSSSFIFAITKNVNNECEVCKNVFNIDFLVKALKNQEIDGDFYGYKSKDEMLDMITQDWGCGVSEDMVKKIIKLPDETKFGHASIGYHSEGIVELIHLFEKAGRITVIYEEYF